MVAGESWAPFTPYPDGMADEPGRLALDLDGHLAELPDVALSIRNLRDVHAGRDVPVSPPRAPVGVGPPRAIGAGEAIGGPRGFRPVSAELDQTLPACER